MASQPRSGVMRMPSETDGTGRRAPQRIELAEERASIGAKTAITGRVRVTTATETFDEVRSRELHGTRVEVTRVPVERMLESGEPLPGPRTEGGVTIVPVFEEILVTETRIVLKEELHITQYETAETVEIPVSLRRQTATVARVDPGDPPEDDARHMEDIMSDFAYDTDTNTRGSQYVTAFFDSRADADAAIDRIVAEGVARDDIRMVEGSETADAPAAQEDKGFFEALGDFFMPDEDRATYAEGLNRGGFLVSLNTNAANRDRILDILDDEGTVDMDEREESWRAEGWTGDTYMEPGAMAGSTGAAPRATGMAEAAPAFRREGDIVDGTIEVVEEKLRVGKREVDHGRVRVRSYVVETPVEETVTLHDETILVERNAVDRPLDNTTDAFADRTIEATETAEEAVVSKEARVVEEITLNKDVADRSETVHDTVRHTEVEVEDDRPDRPDTTDRTKQRM